MSNDSRIASATRQRIGADPKKAAEERALLPGLKEALLWKPNTPQFENAMTYAWEQALRSFIRAIEANTPPIRAKRGRAVGGRVADLPRGSRVGNRALRPRRV